MDKDFITFSITTTLLQEVKSLSAKQNISISEFLINVLEELVIREKGYQQARQRSQHQLEKGLSLGTYGFIKLERGDLHKE